MIYSKLGHIKHTYVFEYKGEMYTVETEQINPAVFDEGTPNTYTFFQTHRRNEKTIGRVEWN